MEVTKSNWRVLRWLILISTAGTSMFVLHWIVHKWKLDDSSPLAWVGVGVFLIVLSAVISWCGKVDDRFAEYSKNRMSDELDNAATKMRAIENSGGDLEKAHRIELLFSGRLTQLRVAAEAMKADGWSVDYDRSLAGSIVLIKWQTLDSDLVMDMTQKALVQERRLGIRYLGFEAN
jgi:hypothetical protein